MKQIHKGTASGMFYNFLDSKCFLIFAFTLFVSLLPNFAHAQTVDKFEANLNSDEKKDLKALQDDWTKHEKMSDFSAMQAKSLVMSQMILGRLGYGTPFTGVADERTKEAIKAYQTNKGLTQSGVID